ncbi:MAG: outer membrane lipoprotein carrier protein LolA [Tistlia sp.]|uniref:outer membrane lipoprotein carrier protein LolA n=1 Tax=Tistlia sp. TaxID=3057121 RepID=UPI0034A2FF91
MKRRDFLIGGAAALTASSLALPRARAQSLSGTLTDADRAELRRAEDYLNGIDTMYSRFRQTASNGNQAAGFLALDRPSRMRFEYDAPHPVVMIADGYELTYYDRELQEARQLPTFETPLWFLLRDRISFGDGLDVLWMKRSEDVMVVRVAQREGNDRGTVNLVFSEQPMQFRGWEIVDAAGVSVQVALENTRYGVELDSEMFDEKQLPGYRSLQRNSR